MSSSIVINCAGDNELARKINDHLMDKIPQSGETIYISLSEDEVEIISEKLEVSKEDIRKLLHEFIKSNPDLADVYSIAEFEDMFVVGIPKSRDEMTVNCEMSGYIASSEEDLIIHKRNTWIDFYSIAEWDASSHVKELQKSLKSFVTTYHSWRCKQVRDLWYGIVRSCPLVYFPSETTWKSLFSYIYE